jgi:hypothetical protein
METEKPEYEDIVDIKDNGDGTETVTAKRIFK